MGSAPLRPLRDLFIGGRNLHAISGTDEKRSSLGRSRHRRLVERRRWRDAEARSSRAVRSPVHHSMPAARLERYRCLRLPRICHPRPEPMASCGRGYSLLVRHALSSLGALAFSQRDLAWFCLARGKLPLFRCARLLALDISGAMRPKAYVISADAMRRRELIRRSLWGEARKRLHCLMPLSIESLRVRRCCDGLGLACYGVQ